MADFLKYIMESMPSTAEANAYGNEIQNQSRMAQAQQMVQEALLKGKEFDYKQTMMPYEIQSKIAAANQMNAQAEASRREKPIDPKKSAEAQMLFQSKLYPYMAAIQAQQDQSKQQAMVEALLKEAQGHGDEALGPILSTPEGRKAFFEAMGRSKEVGKLQHGAAQNATNVIIQDKRGQQALDQIDRKGMWAVRNAEAKAKFAAQKPSKETFENAAVAYERAAEAAEDPAEVERLLKKSKEFTEKANNLKAQSSIVGPGAKVDAQLEALRRLEEWNKKMGGGNRANTTTEPKPQGTKLKSGNSVISITKD